MTRPNGRCACQVAPGSSRPSSIVRRVHPRITICPAPRSPAVQGRPPECLLLTLTGGMVSPKNLTPNDPTTSEILGRHSSAFDRRCADFVGSCAPISLLHPEAAAHSAAKASTIPMLRIPRRPSRARFAFRRESNSTSAAERLRQASISRNGSPSELEVQAQRYDGIGTVDGVRELAVGRQRSHRRGCKHQNRSSDIPACR